MELPSYIELSEPRGHGRELTVTVRLVVDTPRKALAFAWQTARDTPVFAWWWRPAVFCALLLWGLGRVLSRSGCSALLLVAIAALSTPAYAQELTTPDKLANGTVAYVLAVACCGLAAVVIYLFRELRKETAGRMEDLVRSYEAAMKLQESGVKLSIQALEAVEVVERVVERFPRSPA